MNQNQGYSQITKKSSQHFPQLPQQIKHPQHSQHHQSKTTYRIHFLILTLLIYCILGIISYIYPQNYYKVAIIGTNDLHGQVFPTILQRSDNKQKYKYGGLVYMTNMIKTIRQQYMGNIIYLDAGDQYQGGIQASKLVSSGQIMNDYFKIVGLTASTIGNHQFDFGPQFLYKYLSGRNSSNLAANLKSEKGQDNFLPFQKNSQIVTLPNGIKIGIIGLVTLETLTTTAGFSSKLFPDYQFLPYKQTILKQSKLLKQQGVNAIIVVSHVGDSCNSNLTYSIRNHQSVQSDCKVDQITKLIRQLPKGTIDGIVQGHRHKIAHHYYRGIPYMGSIHGGYYFNIMQLTFNSNKQLIQTNIQGPIPVCQKIFQNLPRCNYIQQQQIQKVGKLINWQFHNKIVQQDKQLQKLLQQKYSQKMLQYQQQIIYTQIKLSRNNINQYQQLQLCNLFTNLMYQVSKQYNPNFIFINIGAFRTQWLPGIIKYKDYYNMFPFYNNIQLFQIYGNDLIQTLKIVQNGRRIIQAWNLKMEISININNGNQKQLTNVTFINGTQIERDRIYRGVTLSYLVDGGDQFSNAKGKYFKPINRKILGDFRQIIKPQLIKMKIIKKNTLIDVNNPRLIFRIKE